MDTNRVLRNRYRLPSIGRFTCSSNRHILAFVLLLHVEYYEPIRKYTKSRRIKIQDITTPGRGEKLLRTYLITRRNESKLVIYDFRNSIPNLINRRGPKRRRLASSRSIKYREGSFFCSENPFRPRSLLVSGLNKNN